MIISAEQFWDNLEQLMKEYKVTNKKLSEACEVSQRTIEAQRLRRSYPSLDLCYRMSNYFNIPMEKLLLGNTDAGFSVDERELLDLYKTLPEPLKKSVLDLAKNLKGVNL